MPLARDSGQGGFPGWLLGHGHRTGVLDEVGSGGRGGEVKESLGSGGESNAFLGHQHEGALDLVAAIQDGGFGAGHTVHGQSLDGGLAFHGGQGGIADGVGVAGNGLNDAAGGGQLLVQLAGILGIGDGLETVPVPLPDSRPMQEMAPGSPPTSLQSVILPVKMSAIC